MWFRNIEDKFLLKFCSNFILDLNVKAQKIHVAKNEIHTCMENWTYEDSAHLIFSLIKCKAETKYPLSKQSKINNDPLVKSFFRSQISKIMIVLGLFREGPLKVNTLTFDIVICGPDILLFISKLRQMEELSFYAYNHKYKFDESLQ